MTRIGLLVAIAIALSAGAADAQDRGAKCRTEKMKTVGLYELCRLKAEARAARTGAAASSAPCDEKLVEQWDRIEAAAGGSCPTEGDVGAVQNQVAADVRAIVGILTPPAEACGTYPGCGGACPPGLACGLTAPPVSCGCIAPDPAPCTDTSGGPADFPLCNGSCPAGQVCAGISGDIATVTISCGCVPEQSIPCVNGQDAACGGTCPQGLSCGAGDVFVCECR